MKRKAKSIVISSYNTGIQNNNQKAIIDAKGFVNGILIENCSYIEVHNLTITANAGGMETSGGKLPDMSCGVLVQTSNPGIFENITLSNVVIKDIFYEEPGFKRGAMR